MRDLLELNSPALMDVVNADTAEQLRNIATLMRYQDGQTVHSRGDKKPGLSIVKSGAARVGTFGRDGRFLTLSVLGAGQCFGEMTLLANFPRTHDVIAVGQTALYQIPKNPFQDLFNGNPDLARALLRVSLIRSHYLGELVDDMRRLPLAVRAAKFLLSMQGTAKAQDCLICRQSELAFALGGSRVTIGKALKEFEKRGFIKLGYGKITLEDASALADWVADKRMVDAVD